MLIIKDERPTKDNASSQVEPGQVRTDDSGVVVLIVRHSGEDKPYNAIIIADDGLGLMFEMDFVGNGATAEEVVEIYPHVISAELTIKGGV